MVEREGDDLSDDADYAASVLQQGSRSMWRSYSGSRRSDPSEEEEEVVYMTQNVSIHPTQFISDRIGGTLLLIRRPSSLFMTWIPYKGLHTNTTLSHKDRNLYTITPFPFTQVSSIRRHTPALGWQYVIVVLSSGLAFPPLYFYNGGVKEFLATIKQHVFIATIAQLSNYSLAQFETMFVFTLWIHAILVGSLLLLIFGSVSRSPDDSNVFVVNDFQDPLQKTLSSLELPGVVSIAAPSTSASVVASPSAEKRHDTTTSSQNRIRQKNKFHDPAKDLSIQVLEKFSLVTKFARETTSQLFGEHSGENFFLNDARKPNHSQSLPALHDNISLNEPEVVVEENPVPADPVEFDKMALVWGKPRQSPLSEEEWISFLDSEGRVVDSKALRKRIFYGGVTHELRKEVWPFLLGYYDYNSTYAEREYLRSMRKQDYEIIKLQWQSIFPEQAKRFTKFKERKSLIEKDVVRTDRSFSFYDGDDNPNVDLLYDILLTYSFYNFDLGYCQGMSDYLSPLLFVMGDDFETFWCFASLMERVGPNFNRDQSGMHAQLFALSKLVELCDSPLHNYFKQNDCLNYFFCFRWILIQFKRELRYEETMRLWEILWTHHLSEHFHLYVCMAILKRQRNKIIGEQMDFDTLLKFINELSGQIDLDDIIRDAEALCVCAGETGAASIPPGTPPSLPIENGMLSSQLEDEVL